MSTQYRGPSKNRWVWNSYERIGSKHPITGEPVKDTGFYIVSPPGFDIAYLPITSSMDGQIQGANCRLIVAAVNSYADAKARISDLESALQGLFEHCAMVHKHWGDNNNQKEADAAIAAARVALDKGSAQ